MNTDFLFAWVSQQYPYHKDLQWACKHTLEHVLEALLPELEAWQRRGIRDGLVAVEHAGKWEVVRK